MPTPIDISASRGAAILGISPYKSPAEVWIEIMEARQPGFCEKNNYTLPTFSSNMAMEWGLAFEDAIITEAQKKQKDIIVDRELFIKKNYITCHLDGKYEKTGTLHEGKTTTQFYFRDNFGEPGSDRIPPIYQVQVQHQMLLAKAKKCILSVLVFPKRPEEYQTIPKKTDRKNWAKVLNQMGFFHQYEILADKNLQKIIKEKYKNFWENYVLKKNEPPILLYSDFSLLVKNPIGTIVSSDQVERWAAEYKQINAENSDLKKRKDQLKVLILKYMKKQDAKVEKIIDDDSCEKWVLRDNAGKKLFQYDGKSLR